MITNVSEWYKYYSKNNKFLETAKNTVQGASWYDLHLENPP